MKVFSLKKYLESMERKKPLPWAKECDGQPVEDGLCRGKDGCLYIADAEWCEEISENKVIFKGKETILIKDGKEYVSKCADGDTYDKEKGLLLCLAKANGVSYEDLQKMIDGAEYKLDDATEKAAKEIIERMKTFFEAGFKALKDKDKAEKPEAENAVKEVKRPAKVGEYIKIINAWGNAGLYNNGDVRKVVRPQGNGVLIEEEKMPDGYYVSDNEYVVLENYKHYKITLSEFWGSKDKLAIHCKTKDEAKELLKAFDKAGKKWCTGGKYTKITEYGGYKEKTCYNNAGEYCHINWYKNNNYKIYEFNEVDLNN